MNQGFIRFCDRWLGALACLMLTGVRRVMDRLGRRAEGREIKRVIFLKLIEQGATVLAYSAIKKAVDTYGSSRVHFCVFAENRPILDILALVPKENIFAIRSGNLLLFAFDLLRFLVWSRRKRIDATLDMEFFARAPAIIAYLSGAWLRVGLHRYTSEAPYRGDLLTHRIAYNPYIHTARAYLLMVEALTTDPKDMPLLKKDYEELQIDLPRFEPLPAETQRVRTLLKGKAGYEPGLPLLLLNPNASDLLPLRKWPSERFVDLAGRLLRDHPDATIVLTGAPSEREGAERLCQQIGLPRVISLAGHTTMRELLALYTLADVLVTNDSGPGHFASLTDVDSIVMFGPETPDLFGALGDKSHPIHHHLACSPCVSAYNHRLSACQRNECMDSITVDEVAVLVKSCLEKRVLCRLSARQ